MLGDLGRAEQRSARRDLRGVAKRRDVDDLYALLKRMKATVVDPPADYPDYGKGYYAVFFLDPDGLKLEGMVCRPEKKQRKRPAGGRR